MLSGTSRAIGLALVTALPALAQDEPPPPAPPSPPPAAGSERFQTPLFQVDLPAGWRRLTPNEWLQLSAQLPWTFPRVQPDSADVYGPVDDWLASGYSTGGLVVVNTDFEGETTPDYLAKVEAHWASTELPGGARREVLASRIGTLGRNDHPCLELEIRTAGPGREPVRALEFHASTSGRELILSFQTWDDAFGEVDPLFRAIAETFTFPRPPSDPKDLGSRLAEAAWIGGLVGLALIALRRGLRGRVGGPAADRSSRRPTSPGSNRAENPRP